MQINFTARRFKAHDDIKQHAIEAVEKLSRHFDGIVHADIILSYERASNSIKTAEINLHVHGVILSAKQKSEDYFKSIDAVTMKLGTQLEKYKTKLRAKDKKKVRALKAKI